MNGSIRSRKLLPILWITEMVHSGLLPGQELAQNCYMRKLKDTLCLQATEDTVAIERLYNRLIIDGRYYCSKISAIFALAASRSISIPIETDPLTSSRSMVLPTSFPSHTTETRDIFHWINSGCSTDNTAIGS